MFPGFLVMVFVGVRFFPFRMVMILLVPMAVVAMMMLVLTGMAVVAVMVLVFVSRERGNRTRSVCHGQHSNAKNPVMAAQHLIPCCFD